MPQLISNPTPPGERTPSLTSNAATPPMGKPYPVCTSGIASDHFWIPGSVATFATCCIAPLSRYFIRTSDKKIRPGTRIRSAASCGTSQTYSPRLTNSSYAIEPPIRPALPLRDRCHFSSLLDCDMSPLLLLCLVYARLDLIFRLDSQQLATNPQS